MKARKNSYGFCPVCTKDSPLGTLNSRAIDGNMTCGFCKKTTPADKWLKVSFPPGLGDNGKDRSKMN